MSVTTVAVDPKSDLVIDAYRVVGDQRFRGRAVEKRQIGDIVRAQVRWHVAAGAERQVPED